MTAQELFSQKNVEIALFFSLSNNNLELYMETTERKVSVLGTDYAIRFVAKNQDEYIEKMHFLFFF